MAFHTAGIYDTRVAVKERSKVKNKNSLDYITAPTETKSLSAEFGAECGVWPLL